MDLVRTGVLKKEIPTIFIHTGGLPILFAYEREFREMGAVRKM
jgi:1-aminocyclopropane-1-carboxylate deaminase/D-cysteine desulfhydrase-like pyridoxal-dependent ACC family enzyme